MKNLSSHPQKVTLKGRNKDIRKVINAYMWYFRAEKLRREVLGIEPLTLKKWLDNN